MRTVKITIKGRVQGIFFRSAIRKYLLPTKIVGYVKNLENGDVEVVAQGDDSDIVGLIDYCHRGPSQAEIGHVKVEDIKPIEARSFEILYD